MEKKKIILISVIVLVFVLLVIIISVKKDKRSSIKNNITENTTQSNIKSDYNNETGMYEIVDENSGEVITSAYDEESAKSELEFYKENPDYRANPPASPDAMNETFENEYNY